MNPQIKVDILDKAIGLILMTYVAYCIARGQISARFWGSKYRPVLRGEQPAFFWFVISCHITVALIIIFARW
jgi:hypothetical protein